MNVHKNGVGRIRASAPRMAPVDQQEDAETMTRTGADLICCCHSTTAISSAKGRITTNIASKWPSASGHSAAMRARELLSHQPG